MGKSRENGRQDLMECYLCHSTEHKKRSGSVRDNKELDVLECLSCGLVFLSSKEHISKTYYEESCMSEDLNIQEWLNETATDDKRRFEFVKEMIVNKDVIDFGSGAGGFLIHAKGVAKSVTGIEIDAKIMQHYKNSEITHTTTIESLKDNLYDVITAFHVIEHLSNPVEILKELTKKLKKGGRLIIEVPNSNDALLSIYKSKAFENFTYWSPHLFLYNAKTLELLLKKVDGVKLEFSKYIQRYSLSNHLYWLANSASGGHQKWGSFLDSKELSSAYEAQLSSIGATDTLISQIVKL